MQQTSTLSNLTSPVRVEDPRSPLQVARRRDLRAFCDQKSIPFSYADPATLLRQKIIDAGFDSLAINQRGQTLPDPQIVEPVQDTLDESIDNLGWAELKGKCKEMGIPLKNTDKKPELQAALKDALRGDIT